MDIQELFSMAKAANTKAQIKILMSEDAICIRWIYDHAFGPEWRRTLPMSALGSDRDPYRAVREYIKMDALYMEGRGGTPDRTHSLFQTAAPVTSTLPILTLTPSELRQHDIVEVPESETMKETVKGIRVLGCDYEVFWFSGLSRLYSPNHKLRVIRRGKRHD